jgi:GrpB-like predicted nucleotidyltransferase (UPF0157 family)
MSDPIEVVPYNSQWKEEFHEIGMTYKPLMEGIDYIRIVDNPDKTKRYFREKANKKRTHIHIREVGSWSEQMSLLFRDYLRVHPEDCIEYANVKYKLMEQYRNQRARYVEEKGTTVWKILMNAHVWSQAVGWKPNKTDI